MAVEFNLETEWVDVVTSKYTSSAEFGVEYCMMFT